MFVIKSKFEDQIEIESTLENVRDFFSDPKNFVTLMSGVESIKAMSDTLNRWIIRVDFPVIGTIKQEFLVERTSDSEDFIEWSPAKTEKQNFLRFSADYLVKGANKTVVRLLQMVELRRDKAVQFHLLAMVTNENTISQEMSKHIGKMLNNFLQQAKNKLEK
jgi:uncharacterized membrane protein